MQRHADGTQRQKEKRAGLFQSAGQSLQLTGDFDEHMRLGHGGRIQAPRFVGILSEDVSAGRSQMSASHRPEMVARNQ